MLTVAGRILTEAQHLHCADPASTTIINDARRSDHWLTQSARECSHNIIPDHTNYALATPAEFSPDQRRQLAQLAREIIRNAAVAPITPDWLFHAARHPAPARFPDNDQRHLLDQLDNLIRSYDDWHDFTLSFDDYGDPDEDRVAQLNASHQERMATFGHVIVAAASITAVPLQLTRDAIIVATCGRMNWQCRQEFQMLQRHTDLKDESRLQAIARLHVASQLVEAMPDAVTPPAVRRAVIQHDDELRSHVQLLQE